MDRLEAKSVNYKYAQVLTWVSAPALILICFMASIMMLYIFGALIAFISKPDIIISNLDINISAVLTYLVSLIIVATSLFLETCFIRIGYTDMRIKREKIVWSIAVVFFGLSLAAWIYNLFTTAIVYSYQIVPIVVAVYLAFGFLTGILALRNIRACSSQ